MTPISRRPEIDLDGPYAMKYGYRDPRNAPTPADDGEDWETQAADGDTDDQPDGDS